MKIKILIPRTTKLRNYVVNFYSTYFYKFKKENPTDKTYTKTNMKNHITKVMSVRNHTISPNDIKVPVIDEWKKAGWYEISFWTWFYAVEVRVDKKNNIILRIMDAVHNSEHHNDVMSTTPYDENVQRRTNNHLNEMMNIYYNYWYYLLWGK